MDLIWFKRDLRLSDHQPLFQSQGRNVRLVYIFEPVLIADEHYHERHWCFIWQALAALNKQLKLYQLNIEIYFGPAIDVFQALHTDTPFQRILSYEETGLLCTFERDQAVKHWCSQHQIQWLEYQTNAVIRGLKTRKNWHQHWYKVMADPIKTVDLADFHPHQGRLNTFEIPKEFERQWSAPPSAQVQPGGMAPRYLENFFTERAREYHLHISKPILSRRSCSRLSPYLAWGQLSLREVQGSLAIIDQL